MNSKEFEWGRLSLAGNIYFLYNLFCEIFQSSTVLIIFVFKQDKLFHKDKFFTTNKPLIFFQKLETLQLTERF